MEQENKYEGDQEISEETLEGSSWEPVISSEFTDPSTSSEASRSEEDLQGTNSTCEEPSIAESIPDDANDASEAAEPVPSGTTSGMSDSEVDTEEIESTPTPVPNSSNPPSIITPDMIDEKLNSLVSTEQRIFTEVREMHKLYHTEFAGRLLSMQNELEQYRKIEKGRVFDDILAALARIYVNNETLADEVSDPKVKKSIRYLLMDLEELMESYGMNKLRSVQGEKRNPRHCQIRNRIPTDDSQKHDTVIKSYGSGFFIGNRTIIKEVVDVLVYEELNDADNTQIIETGDNTVTE